MIRQLLSRLGARVGNWNDGTWSRHLEYGRFHVRGWWWRPVDRVCGWLYKLGDTETRYVAVTFWNRWREPRVERYADGDTAVFFGVGKAVWKQKARPTKRWEADLDGPVELVFDMTDLLDQGVEEAERLKRVWQDGLEGGSGDTEP